MGCLGASQLTAHHAVGVAVIIILVFAGFTGFATGVTISVAVIIIAVTQIFTLGYATDRASLGTGAGGSVPIVTESRNNFLLLNGLAAVRAFDAVGQTVPGTGGIVAGNSFLSKMLAGELYIGNVQGADLIAIIPVHVVDDTVIPAGLDIGRLIQFTGSIVFESVDDNAGDIGGNLHDIVVELTVVVVEGHSLAGPAVVDSLAVPVVQANFGPVPVITEVNFHVLFRTADAADFVHKFVSGGGDDFLCSHHLAAVGTLFAIRQTILGTGGCVAGNGLLIGVLAGKNISDVEAFNLVAVVPEHVVGDAVIPAGFNVGALIPSTGTIVLNTADDEASHIGGNLQRIVVLTTGSTIVGHGLAGPTGIRIRFAAPEVQLYLGPIPVVPEVNGHIPLSGISFDFRLGRIGHQRNSRQQGQHHAQAQHHTQKSVKGSAFDHSVFPPFQIKSIWRCFTHFYIYTIYYRI